jgi:Xaa-Pro aminopeptidase
VLTIDQFGQLRRALTKVRFVKLPPSFSDILVPKTEHELRSMKQAAAIGDRAFFDMRRGLRIGMTETEAAHFIEDRSRKYGSEKPSFDTIVLFGSRTALPHGRPSGARLKRGDWVLCDFGCTVNGFCSDMTRTLVMGKASARQKKIYGIVLRAQESGKAVVTAGARACDVDKACRQVISGEGFGKMFGHATGHGVGIRIHERPRIGKNDNTILRAGTMITVEPGIYIPAFGGVRIEDMVIVRVCGSEVITNAPRALIEAEGIR